MKGLLAILAVYWFWAAVIGAPLLLTGCSAIEIYGGIRRTDTIETRTTTTAPKTSWTDAVTDWLFVDHSKGGKA